MPNKLALLIGIDKYPFLADFAQLKGCKNDVFALKNILEQKFGFPRENIRTLLDEEATRDEILAAMSLIIENCGDNDAIVFSFSGHGSRLRARKKDKPSGWYETIMPFNSGRKLNKNIKKRKSNHPDGVNRDITDDKIYEWLMKLSKKTSNIVLIFDSCYAGSIIRDDYFEAGTRGFPPDDTFIYEAPKPVFFHSQPFTKEDAGAKTGRSGWLPVSDKYVLFAACAEHERAHVFKEKKGRKVTEYGVLTYFLCQSLREAKSTYTYRDIWEQVYINVKTRFEKQNAQLEGNRDRELFGLKEFPPFPFLLVSEKQKNLLTLSGGRLHGVKLNSQWAIYPAGTKFAGTDEDVLGKAKVVSVRTATAKAALLGRTNKNIIKAGSRAVEISRPQGKSRLKIWLDTVPPEFERQFNQLKQSLCKSLLLNVVAKKELADARIHHFRNFTWHVDDSLKLQAGNIPEPVWLVFGEDNQLLMPPRANTEIIIENLERISRYRRIVELRNPNSALIGKIDFIILRQNPDTSWSEVVPAGIEQNLVIYESERIALRIVNRFKSPVFFSILDLGLSKNISLLYPPPGANIIIGAAPDEQSVESESDVNGKGIFTLGMTENEYIELSFPKNFPFVAPFPGHTDVPDEGLEIFKLIVTTRPHDLGFIKQGYTRAVLDPESSVTNLIIDSLRGDREFNKESLARSQNEWLTIEKFFVLKRK